MRTFHIYTDASCKDTSMFPCGIKRTTKVGVIVVDSHIFDIYYNRKEKFIDSSLAEQQAITESINYVREKYHSNNITVHTDALDLIGGKFAKKLIENGIKINYVKGHCPNRKGLKYRFNYLADWISRKGINYDWRGPYYRQLSKCKSMKT